MRPHHFFLVLAAALWLAAPAAAADRFPPSWPPAGGPGDLFVHYGEEHWNDIDGAAVLTRVVADAARFRPALVTMSGDKGNDGTAEQLQEWLRIMGAYDEAGIPWMAGVGNHDGKQQTPEDVTEVAAGSTPLRDITFYKQVFAPRPYPMGDAAPYAADRMAPKVRDPGDPDGAATHFWVDYGEVRWVFLDNSCFGIQNCDPLQSPPDDKGRAQLEFLEDAANEANAQGKLLFVVTHMPTRDPRDQEQAYITSVNHVMGKGVSPDNQLLEAEAQRLGVDGVFLGHIKGQFQYRGAGEVPYYIDGGAGGELYSAGPLGVDYGYWYGFRLLRVRSGRVVTDVVPVVAEGGLSVEGPAQLQVGGPPVTFRGFARQPATKSERAVVDKLELRDPDPIPKSSAAFVPGWIVWLAPLALVALLVAPRPAPVLRRTLVPAVSLGVLALAAVAVAQGQGEPTATPREALPNPSRIFTSGNARVLEAVDSQTDDPRRHPRRQTADGAFRPMCPGVTHVGVTAGWQTAKLAVRVTKAPGRVAKSVRRRGRRVVVDLAQPTIVRVSRGRRVLRDACLPAGRHGFGPHRGRITVRVKGAGSRSFRLR